MEGDRYICSLDRFGLAIADSDQCSEETILAAAGIVLKKLLRSSFKIDNCKIIRIALADGRRIDCKRSGDRWIIGWG